MENVSQNQNKPEFLRKLEENPIDYHPIHGWYCYRCHVQAFKRAGDDPENDWDGYEVVCPKCRARRWIITD